MLHFESRKGSAQGNRALTFLSAALIALIIFACKQQASAEEEVDLAALKMELLYKEHAQEAQQELRQFLANDKDTAYADRMGRGYYRLGTAQWLWMDSPTKLSMCDALDSVIRTQVSSIGFSEKTFFLPEIEQALAVMHQPDSAENVGQSMGLLEGNLTKAYLRYTIGQRFGFTTPKKLFGKDHYDIEIEQADSAFVKHALEQLTDTQTMLNFLAEVEPSDKAYQQLKLQLAQDSTEEERLRTICNMERLRWRDSKHPEQAERHILVNVAAQQVWALGPDSVINMRICCGKASTKSPLLSSAIERIQINPEWGIPQSIIRGEVSGHAGDSAYFARRNYYITNGQGQRVDPRSLTRAELSSGRYAVRQRSGAGNSLGRIIFRFPNRFSVYLHDTSSPSAFNRDVRTVSHGCIRLQRPFDIATFVLPNADPWLLDQMRLSMDLQPQTDQGKEYKRTHRGAIRLINATEVEPKIPVVINYFTKYPNPKTGTIDTWGDPYSYDKILQKAIKPFLP